MPALAPHDGGEADVVEHGRRSEASRRVLTWRREKSYGRQEQVHVELTVTVLKEVHEGQSVTSAVIKKILSNVFFMVSEISLTGDMVQHSGVDVSSCVPADVF